MLILLRILFAAALAYAIHEVKDNAQLHPDTGDLANAGWLAVCVGLGILNAIVWAPYIGGKVAEPIFGTMTSGAFIDQKNRWVQLIRWFERHHCRRLTLIMCFLEGVRQPWMPSAFVIGFDNSPPGSWWEKIYAREVYRFNNTKNSLLAYQALKRHGLRPAPHPNPEVDLAIMAMEKPEKPLPAIVPVPPAPHSVPLKRHPNIQLFAAGEAQLPPGSPGSGDSSSATTEHSRAATAPAPAGERTAIQPGS